MTMVGWSTVLLGSNMLLELVKRAVFPRFCLLCGVEGELLCGHCLVDFSTSTGDRISRFESEHETDPAGHVFNFRYADPVVRGLICAWKYNYDQSAWQILQKLLGPRLMALRDIVATENIEAIVTLPLHRTKLNARGFDQARLLAQFIASQLKIDRIDLLERFEETGKQAERSDSERKKTMEKSPFKIIESMYVPRRLLLVDDVWTTGATAGAATVELKKAGAEQVWVYTVAKGR